MYMYVYICKGIDHIQGTTGHNVSSLLWDPLALALPLPPLASKNLGTIVVDVELVRILLTLPKSTWRRGRDPLEAMSQVRVIC